MTDHLARLRRERDSFLGLYTMVFELTRTDPATVWAFLLEESERFGAHKIWIAELMALWLNLLDDRPETREAIDAEVVLLAMIPRDTHRRIVPEQAVIRYWIVYDLKRADELATQWWMKEPPEEEDYWLTDRYERLWPESTVVLLAVALLQINPASTRRLLHKLKMDNWGLDYDEDRHSWFDGIFAELKETPA